MKKTTKIVMSFMLIVTMVLGVASVNNVKAAAGDTIAETFPDVNLAQAVADEAASGDVNAVLSQGMIDNLLILDASNRNIVNLTGIDKLTSLTNLDLHNNRITSLPDSIGSLSGLTELHLYSNQLTSLPDSIGNLTSLIGLYLFNNQITSLPNTIGNLSSLTNLNLYNNKLTNLPDSIGNLSSLTGLYVYNNKLTSLPNSIGNLSNLTDLYLPSNQLTSLPNSIGNLSKLVVLNLNNNQLTSLPDSIKNLSSLTDLNLINNLLPTGYSAILNSLGLPVTTDDAQDQLKIANQTNPFSIKSQTDLDAIDYVSLLSLNSRSTLSSGHQYILEGYLDENNQPIVITDYIQNGIVIKTGKVSVQVRATGTGLFANNSDHAITTGRIELNFEIPAVNEYQLSFNLNGGSGSAPTSQKLIKDALTITVDNPTREGYTFKSWNTAQDGSGITWDFATAKMPESNVTLYAQWEKNNEPITEVKPNPNLPETGNSGNAIRLSAILIGSGVLIFVLRKKKTSINL